ncbi:hypothetical protein GCM10023084_66230 [Streptomyces lacrimifluminis]|uniref:Uncharacterized protein n=1 Tax=Streptomyces lacrimifluminis TaxID=1500077 RepID=A0A917LDG0_9ACTN|nr:hypothetical protein [Streptomyces lacrimifluminis]GGJ60095.1 hypothetical protein GCM10012282_66710 [Streptomyces lacrimifluminis]
MPCSASSGASGTTSTAGCPDWAEPRGPLGPQPFQGPSGRVPGGPALRIPSRSQPFPLVHAVARTGQAAVRILLDRELDDSAFDALRDLDLTGFGSVTLRYDTTEACWVPVPADDSPEADWSSRSGGSTRCPRNPGWDGLRTILGHVRAFLDEPLLADA